MTWSFIPRLRGRYSAISMLEIYTDGSSKEGIGSWAYVISCQGKTIREHYGRVRSATSNAMEIQAAIEALTFLPANSHGTLFSDSRILVDAMTLSEIPRSYQKQIDILRCLNQKHSIRWQWIKAHNGNELNERCDLLCNLARLMQRK